MRRRLTGRQGARVLGRNRRSGPVHGQCLGGLGKGSKAGSGMIAHAFGCVGHSRGSKQQGQKIRTPSEASQKGEQRLAVCGSHGHHRVALGLRLAVVPEDRPRHAPRPPIVQQLRVARDSLGQAKPPKRRGLPFIARGATFGAVVGQTGA